MAGRFFGWKIPRIRMGIKDEGIASFAGEAVSLKKESLRKENGIDIVDVIFINIGEPHNLKLMSVPVDVIENF